MATLSTVSTGHIGVMGAGAIGCYVGGRLAAAGARVVLVGRARLRAEIGAAGLTVTELDGLRQHHLKDVAFETSADALRDCDTVLCCVKSGHTTDAAAELARVISPDATVISLQNGLHNADLLRAGLPRHAVFGGIVSFNVVSKGAGVFRQATSGPLVIERPSTNQPQLDGLEAMLAAAGLEALFTQNLRPLRWSKLVMNLNNAIGALTDRPTRDLLFLGEFRRILAAIIAEAVGVLEATGTETAKLGPLPVRLFPVMLRLPSPIFRVVARAQVKVDAEARSSMWEDVTRGRKTEVDELNGEIVRLAASRGLTAPLNAKIVELIREVEAKGEGSPKLGADALWRRLHEG